MSSEKQNYQKQTKKRVFRKEKNNLAKALFVQSEKNKQTNISLPKWTMKNKNKKKI